MLVLLFSFLFRAVSPPSPRPDKNLPPRHIQARRELSAITIQSDWRCFAAKKQLWRLRRLRDEAAARRRRRENAAVLIQSIARMRVGR